MTTALRGQTVVVRGGSGLTPARRAPAGVILTGRDPARLARAAAETGATSTTAFGATGFARLERFFAELPTPAGHVLVTAGGPYSAPPA
jgi:hypothetical protein